MGLAQNEMKAKPALPERVRSMEGLGVTRAAPLLPCMSARELPGAMVRIGEFCEGTTWLQGLPVPAGSAEPHSHSLEYVVSLGVGGPRYTRCPSFP